MTSTESCPSTLAGLIAPVGHADTVDGLALGVDQLVPDGGGPTMDAEDGDVRAVHRAAHVQAACESDAQLGGQLLGAVEVREQVVHHGLDDAGSVGSGGVAVHPALRVDDVRDRGAHAAHGIAFLLQVGDQRVDLGFVDDQELDVVAAGEPQVSVAVLVGQVGEESDRLDAHQTRRRRAHGPELVSGVGRVHEHAGLGDLVILPLPVVLLDHGRKELFEMGRTDVGLPLSRSGCHYSSSSSSSKKM